MAQASFKDQAKERFSMPTDSHQRWKNDDVFLDENQIFNEDANYFEITQPLRKTFNAGQMKDSSFFGEVREPHDQPLRISKL